MMNNFLIHNFKHLTTTPENVEQLKKLVLQMAVQGNLTAKWREENLNVEPASVLLEKIKTEKEHLIKEGKIKRQKPSPPITDEEKPFELPESWEWGRLDFFSNYGQSLKIEPKNIKNQNIWVLELEDIEKITSKLLQKVRFKERKSKSTKSVFQKGDVLYGKLRPYLDKVIVADEDGICTTEIIPIKIIGSLNPYFIRLTLKRSDFLNYVDTQVSGMRMPRLKTESARNALIPLPPLLEQQAIVSKVEKLFTQIDQLHALAQKRLNYREKSAKALFSKINHPENDTELQETWQTLTAHFHTLTQSKESVKQLRQSILQLAVQGKLTAKWREKNPDVEPASVLLEKIKDEKEQLIKDKIVKKGKKQPPATTNYLDIPKSWLLVDLDDISQFITDGTHQTPRYVEKGKIFLSAQNIKPFKFMPEQHKYVSEAAYLEYIKNKKTEKGDILVGRVGSKGEAAVVDRELDFAIYVSLGLVKTFQNYTSPDYLVVVMNSPYGSSYATGNMSSLGASAGNFNLGRIRSFPIPFPSLLEQKAIVSKVNQLMSLCDELEKKIEKRDAYQEKMMQAVVKQAFKTEKETVEME